jgi:hypothetical protein
VVKTATANITTTRAADSLRSSTTAWMISAMTVSCTNDRTAAVRTDRSNP